MDIILIYFFLVFVIVFIILVIVLVIYVERLRRSVVFMRGDLVILVKRCLINFEEKDKFIVW